jgi:ribosomal protein S6--L-glutamate ligase/tetrahydromethanopterin:alpha-L-glutamate ligase
LKIGIITRNEESWCSAQLKKSLIENNAVPVCFGFRDLVARIGLKPEVSAKDANAFKELDALIVRPIGRGSLEEIIFRMDLLHRLERLGMLILNPPSAIEKSVDKYYTLALLEEAGLPVPRTIVAENADASLKAFRELGGDVVVKPIFGSRGIGSARISDVDVAERVFRVLSFHHQVVYLQEFISHGDHDLRILVLGGEAVASMRRVANSWKTNVSLGASPMAYNPSIKIKGLAVKAAETIGCELAGVDILESEKGPLIIELNSQPGWKGLQSVTTWSIADRIVKYVLSRLDKRRDS